MSCEPVSRRYAHSDGVTHFTFNSKQFVRIATYTRDILGRIVTYVNFRVLKRSKYFLKCCHTTPSEAHSPDIVAVLDDPLPIGVAGGTHTNLV